MKTTRRSLLRASALGGMAAAFSGCERMTSQIAGLLGEALPQSLSPAAGAAIDPDFHLLSRAAFGPRPGDLERIKQVGRQAWLEEQLNPDTIDDTACDLRAERFESLYFSAGSAYEFRKPVLRSEITRHALLKAVYSRRQLFEVMVEFWGDHLNIDLEKGDCIYLKPSDDRDVIRRHALGSFYDLIRASATSPAMLVYLDGRSNKVRKGTQDKPNENYARELMELHTMGVHNGYTQQDVSEAARCLSGWTFDATRTFALNRGNSFFRKEWHDDGPKTVLGTPIAAGGGPRDLDALVDIVCSHPSTARFISTKLCRRFVSSNPPESVLKDAADAFARSHGDIKTVLRCILNSEAFNVNRGVLLKRPFKFVVSALRATGADTHAGPGITEALHRMGHGPFQYPTPDGYPDQELPWMGTLMWRWNFALALANNSQPGARVALAPLLKALGSETRLNTEGLFGHCTGRSPTAAELEAFAAASDRSEASPGKISTETTAGQTLGLILCSPAFQRC
jgi:uncharacterized protein (DUF1800 family)